MSVDSAGPERLIHVMDEALANKIAAGEVVQRPAAAVKELVENAIDAGAETVTVVLKAAGSELIQVVDDGCGMSPEDAVVCFQRHATSKIRSIDDLDRLCTLGFRGEALASIAAVAQVELKTKRVQDQAGFRVRIDGGKLVASEPCAAPEGTSIAVRNLFFNVPARRNFLKTPATEFKHLVEAIQFLALANPTVGFTLIHDDNEVYRLSPARTPEPHRALRQRIGELFAADYADNLVRVEETTSYLSVEGFVSLPEFHRRSRGEQFLFVNGRYVKNRYLEHAVVGAYDQLLPEGAFPFFALFLRLDPRHVDVNVHPTKAEVKFDDERGIYGFLKAVVRKALGAADLTPQLDLPARYAETLDAPTFEAGPRSVAPPRTPSRSNPDDTGERRTSIRMPLGALSERLYQADDSERQTTMLPSAARPALDAASPDAAETPEAPEGESVFWQLHHRYIVTQIHSGLMIVDQQAAHERILYERTLESMDSGFGMSQQVMFPQTLDFSPADYELLKELLPHLRSMGFDVEFFSGRSVVVRGVPAGHHLADIRPGDEKTLLDDLLQQYKTFRTDLQLKGRENLARSIARRKAVPPGRRLSPEEMRTLIDQLFLCRMPYVSPHGHPTFVKISLDEMKRRFAS